MEKDASLAEVYGGPLDVDSSLYRYIEGGLRSNPHGPAVIAMHQPPGHLSELTDDEEVIRNGGGEDCLTWTHAQLHRATRRLAVALRAQGVKPGSNMITLMSNRIEWALMIATAALLQLNFVAIDFGALVETRRAELEGILKRLPPAVIVVANEDGSRSVGAALASVKIDVPVKIVLDGDDSISKQTNWQTLHAVFTAAPYDPEQEARVVEEAMVPEPDRIVGTIFTSGTSSGISKGCPRAARETVHTLECYQPFFGEQGRCLFLAANFRVIAPNTALGCWKTGGTIIMPGAQFDPATALEAIERLSPTNILLLPVLFHALVAADDTKILSRSSLKLAMLGADMITNALLEQVERAIPGAKVANSHGMSEGGGTLVWPFYETLTCDLPTIGGIAPVGAAGPGSRLRIVDPDKQCVVKRDETGELHMCSPNLISHYLGGEDEEAFYEDEVGRWFKTGDNALITKDGTVFILGRLSQRFKRAGLPITPAALEACLAEYVGTSVAVLGIPHPTLGREPFAIVGSFEGKTEDQINTRIVEVFGKDSALGGAISLKQLGLDQFPLNATGKIQKTELQIIVEVYLKE